MELTKDLSRILDIGIALTGEKNYNCLMNKLLLESLEITECDAGYIYVIEPEGLRAVILMNKTMGLKKGINGERIPILRIPLDSGSICTDSVLLKRVHSVSDIYTDNTFSYQTEKEYDLATGYRTQSIMVVPLISHEEEVLGVLQLVNAKKDGVIVPFDKKYEHIIFSLATQAAVSLANMKHIEEMKRLLNSMVRAFTTAIDERTPYNANHTMQVASYTEQLIDYSNELHEAGEAVEWYDKERKDEIVMAALLHDIGKLTTPLGVMNKSNRLGNTGLEIILYRYEMIETKMKNDYLEGRILEETYLAGIEELHQAEAMVRLYDKEAYLNEADIIKINELAAMIYVDASGRKTHYLTEHEKDNLSIRKGTLSAFERSIMQNHVVVTSKMLGQIRFGNAYKNVPKLAGCHHEFLDGSGYPNHLRGDEIPKDAQILVVMDIFDSLISTDRPYKDPITMEEALQVLTCMANDGKIDQGLVSILIKAVNSGKLYL